MNIKFFFILFVCIILFSKIAFTMEPLKTLDPALNQSIKGMTAYEKAYEALMQNTVNSNTPGFKEVGVSNISSNNNVKNIVYHKFIIGPAIHSGNNFDFLISGPGFFELNCPWGKGYTRDGRFTIDHLGRLVTIGTMFPVLGESGEIYILPGSFSVSDKGIIYINEEQIAMINVVYFDDLSKLTSLNGSIFYFEKETDAKIVQNFGEYSIRQGYYEASNVNLTGQLSQIPIIKNMYDANTKAVKLIMKSLNAGVSLGNPQ